MNNDHSLDIGAIIDENKELRRVNAELMVTCHQYKEALWEFGLKDPAAVVGKLKKRVKELEVDNKRLRAKGSTRTHRDDDMKQLQIELQRSEERIQFLQDQLDNLGFELKEMKASNNNLLADLKNAVNQRNDAMLEAVENRREVDRTNAEKETLMEMLRIAQEQDDENDSLQKSIVEMSKREVLKSRVVETREAIHTVIDMLNDVLTPNASASKFMDSSISVLKELEEESQLHNASRNDLALVANKLGDIDSQMSFIFDKLGPSRFQNASDSEPQMQDLSIASANNVANNTLAAFRASIPKTPKKPTPLHDRLKKIQITDIDNSPIVDSLAHNLSRISELLPQSTSFNEADSDCTQLENRHLQLLSWLNQVLENTNQILLQRHRAQTDEEKVNLTELENELLRKADLETTVFGNLSNLVDQASPTNTNDNEDMQEIDVTTETAVALEELKDARKQLDDVKDEREKLLEQVAKLMQESEEVKRGMASVEKQLRDQLVNSDASLDALRQERDSVMTDLLAAREQLSQSNDEREALEQELNDVLANLCDLEKRLNSVQQSAKEEKARLEQILSEASNKNEELTEKLATARSEEERKMDEIVRERHIVGAQMESFERQCEQLLEENSQLKARLTDSAALVNTLQEDVRQSEQAMEQRVSDLHQQILALANERTDLQDDLDNLRTKLQETENDFAEQLQALKGERDRLLSEKAEQEDRWSLFSSKIENVERQRLEAQKTWEDERVALEEKNAHLEKTVQEANLEARRLHEHLHDLQLRAQQADAAEAEVEELQIRVRQFEKAELVTCERLKSLDSEIETAVSKGKYEELKSLCFEMRNKLKRRTSMLERYISEVVRLKKLLDTNQSQATRACKNAEELSRQVKALMEANRRLSFANQRYGSDVSQRNSRSDLLSDKENVRASSRHSSVVNPLSAVLGDQHQEVQSSPTACCSNIASTLDHLIHLQCILKRRENNLNKVMKDIPATNDLITKSLRSLQNEASKLFQN